MAGIGAENRTEGEDTGVFAGAVVKDGCGLGSGRFERRAGLDVVREVGPALESAFVEPDPPQDRADGNDVKLLAGVRPAHDRKLSLI